MSDSIQTKDKSPSENTKASSKECKPKKNVPQANKVIKAEWTLDRCKRYARRFESEAVWASAASASYKAAIAHGWREDCLSEMKNYNSTATKKAA